MPKQTTATALGMTRGESILLKPAAAETTSTTGGVVVATADLEALSIVVAVTAVSGTSPTMTVLIEGSSDGTNFYAIATFGANGYALGSVASAPSNLTAAATVRGCIPVPAFIRYRSVIGGTTPSFTYSVTAG